MSFTAWSRNESTIDWMIWILPVFPSIKEVCVARISPMKEVTPLKDRLARLAANPWIVSLDLSGINATDKDIASLERMSQLEWLDLTSNPEISDTGIAHLANCTRLRYLDVGGTGVTPAGIAALKRCQKLEHLSMVDCVVTDDNVKLIPRFPRMTYIRFDGTALTEKGLEHFLNWHFLSTFGVDPAIPRQSRIEFNKRFKAEWERAKAAGEDVAPEKRLGRPLYVPE